MKKQKVWKGVLIGACVLIFGLTTMAGQVTTPTQPQVQVKPKANQQRLSQMYRTQNKTPQIKIKKRWVALIPTEMMLKVPPSRLAKEHLSGARQFLSRSKSEYPLLDPKNLMKTMSQAEFQKRTDHRFHMTAVRDQGDRGTCVAHAAVAALEAFSSIPDDLSEQYAYAFLKAELDPNGCMDGLVTWETADVLTRKLVCPEQFWPYNPNEQEIEGYPPCLGLDVLTQTPIPEECERHDKYGITSYLLVLGEDVPEDYSIRNVDYLRRLLFDKNDIVFALYVSGTDWEEGDGILDVQLDNNGRPLSGGAGHAILMCGFDDAKQYFIMKNSWGEDWGHQGYAYISYDYIRQYAKYGYVIKEPKPGE